MSCSTTIATSNDYKNNHIVDPISAHCTANWHNLRLIDQFASLKENLLDLFIQLLRRVNLFHQLS